MTIYRKGENQFGLHESARHGQDKLELNRRVALEKLGAVTNDPETLTFKNLQDMQEGAEFLREDVHRQISYEAALEDITIGQHKTENAMLNAVARMSGVDEDVSVPISGDDLAKGAAGKKLLDSLKDME